MSASLMTSRRFAPLFWCQAFSAFGDNFLKTALVFLILFRIGGADSEALITLAGATLIFPFFILSGLGGELADRYDKALVARRLKLAEIAVAALAVAGFATHSIVLLFVAVGLYGTIASLFGPIKYGILPDHLARSELPSGNALVEGGTFLAILLGTIVAGLAAKDGGDPIHFAWLMMVSSVACWVASRFIPPTGEGAPNLAIRRNIFASTGALIKYVRGDKRLWWGALVTSWFWLTGALVMSLLPPMVSFHIGGSEGVVTVFLTIFSVAVAIGSALAAWLAHGRIILLPTLVAAVLLGLFSIDLGWTSSAMAPAAHPLSVGEFFSTRYSIHVAIDLAGLALSGGLFIVPAFSAVQAWAGADHRARVVAAINVLNAAFMVVGAIVLAVLQKLGFHDSLLFVVIGVANLVVAVIIARTHADKLAQRSSFDRFPHALPARSHRPREHRQGRRQRHHRHESRELPRSANRDVDFAQAAGLRRRRRDFEALVDSAVLAFRAHHGARSAQADGDARRHQRRARRQHAGDLPGRPHHAHRQPDEDL
jgi:acyl-[acyl-carrier-protein]-phospholipid O-acyltransferase/long-chain-fatty-acid--[acyl-carrier-protein] ligase